jgi:C1A family cysteine protease
MGAHKFGWVRSKFHDPRDFVYKPHRHLAAALPTSVDLRTTGFLPPVYDQGQLGSCGPNSASRILAFDEAKQGKKVSAVPSRLFIYWCTRALMGTLTEDSGVDNRTMFKAINQWGFPGEDVEPYSDDASTFLKKPSSANFGIGWHERIVNYLAIPQTATSMKARLASGYPILVGFTVYESFESQQVANTGVVPMPSPGEQVLGGHDVTVVGYDDNKQVWIVENSWGKDWGMSGFFTFPQAYLLDANLSGDYWSVTSIP